MNDAEARHSAVRSYDRNVIVVAGAGTGKTSLLIERLLNQLVERDLGLDEIAAITFTERAATELRTRLEAGLERLVDLAGHPDRNVPGTSPADRAYAALAARLSPTAVLSRAERLLGQTARASIDSIHGYCASLLRQFPAESGVDPDFAIDDGPLFDALREELWEEFLCGRHGPEGEPTRRLAGRAAPPRPGRAARDRLAARELRAPGWSNRAGADARAARPSDPRTARHGRGCARRRDRGSRELSPRLRPCPAGLPIRRQRGVSGGAQDHSLCVRARVAGPARRGTSHLQERARSRALRQSRSPSARPTRARGRRAVPARPGSPEPVRNAGLLGVAPTQPAPVRRAAAPDTRPAGRPPRRAEENLARPAAPACGRVPGHRPAAVRDRVLPGRGSGRAARLSRLPDATRARQALQRGGSQAGDLSLSWRGHGLVSSGCGTCGAFGRPAPHAHDELPRPRRSCWSPWIDSFLPF